MKKLFTIVGILLFAGLTKNVMGQGSTVTGTTADAEIITPLALTETGQLNFGKLSVTSAPGTLVLSTAGVRSATGGVNWVPASTATTATYHVVGAASTGYTITVPGTITVNRSGGGTMTITSKVKAATAADGVSSGTLTALGTDDFAVGGTLNVGASQTVGAYTGTFDVTVNYN